MKHTQGISCALDLESDGKRFGSLNLSHSDNEHAFATIPIPIVVIANGAGPTVLLTAGNHGNEYEGQVILRRLIQETEPGEISGRLIILPALNYPAMVDNARVSPLDGGNLNRCFPGSQSAGPTSAIAHFVTTELLPLCDAGIDFHSGGSDADYLPCAFLCTCDDKVVFAKSLELAEAFGAPYTFVVSGEEAPTGFDPAAQSLGVPFISNELSGGAGVDKTATRIGHNGLNNALVHLGVLPAERRHQSGATVYLDAMNGSSIVSSPITGICETLIDLGDQVPAGTLAARVYSLEEIDRPPVELKLESAGTVVVRRLPARVVRGSHVYVVASEMARDDVLNAVA